MNSRSCLLTRLVDAGVALGVQRRVGAVWVHERVDHGAVGLDVLLGVLARVAERAPQEHFGFFGRAEVARADAVVGTYWHGGGSGDCLVCRKMRVCVRVYEFKLGVSSLYLDRV